MINDKLLKIICIPILATGIPVFSGIIDFSRLLAGEVVIHIGWLILIAYLIWSGCYFLHKKVREWKLSRQSPYSKLFLVCFLSAIYSISSGSLLMGIGSFFLRFEISFNTLLRFSIIISAAVFVFTLIYEVLFLNTEVESEEDLITQLDDEKTHAELEALKNEMDPHFVFNSLETLDYFITENPELALVYNKSFASLYRYFLENKNKDFVLLSRELDFARNYFLLQEKRFQGNISLRVSIDPADAEKILVPPGSFQVAIENAIKHNMVNNQKPLHIHISKNGAYLKISNNCNPKKVLNGTYGIGLKNLELRFILLCNQVPQTEKQDGHFILKLPIILKEDQNAQTDYN